MRGVRLVDRYVGLTIVRHFAYALAGLLAVFAVINLTEELRSAGNPGWGVGRAIWFVVLTLPSEAYTLFPAAALLGAVLGLGRMASDNEIVALQAAGVSPLRLALAALLAAVVLASPAPRSARSSRHRSASGRTVSARSRSPAGARSAPRRACGCATARAS